MSDISNKEIAQNLYKRVKGGYNKMHELYDFCYKDESNDIWDAEHDSLIYELQGVNEELEDFIDEFRRGEYEIDGWLTAWRKSIDDLESQVNRLDNYRKATIIVEENKPTYVYC